MAGDALEMATVKCALTEVDAIIQSLGVSVGPEIILKPTRLFSKATRVLVTAMEEAQPPNSGCSYARRYHAGRICPCSWMSPPVGSILGEQRPQPAHQSRLYTRQHRAGAQSAWRDCVFVTDTRSALALN